MAFSTEDLPMVGHSAIRSVLVNLPIFCLQAMNIRKNIDYSALLAVMDVATATQCFRWSSIAGWTL